MAEFKGTKGKWSQKFEGCEPSRVIRSDDGNKEVAQIYRYNSESEQKANALLISKSPLLLKAIKDSINELREVGLNDMANYHEKLYNECVNL